MQLLKPQVDDVLPAVSERWAPQEALVHLWMVSFWMSLYNLLGINRLATGLPGWLLGNS